LRVEWNEPDNHGLPLLSYTVYFRQSNGSFSTILSDCNGASSNVLEYHYCYLRMSNLVASPFNLQLGELVVGYIVATNAKGTSSASPLNFVGGIIQNVPQTALTLSRGNLTDATNIFLVWNLLPSGFD
jgi:hypothetical protein